MSLEVISRTRTTVEGGERCVFSSWKYSHYFEFMSAKDENIKVRCTGDKVRDSKGFILNWFHLIFSDNILSNTLELPNRT